MRTNISYHLHNSTELGFYNKYRIYPDDLFIILRQNGFSSEVYSDIQHELEIIYEQMKIEYEFTPIEMYSGYCPF